MKNYFDLTGQVAIVTGASTGLAVQMSRALANQGCNIACLARRQEKIDATAKMLVDEYGVEAIAVRCDVTDTDMVEDAVKQVMDKWGRIDILINCAGTGAVAPAEEITDQQFDGEFQIDLFGTFKMARAVANQAMLPAGYGRIINIASMYGLVGNKQSGCAPYHAAKGGVVNLTRALAAEWGRKGITVNAICPGYFETPLTVEWLNSPENQAYARTMIPEERYGKEGELDTATLFLSSPASTYVNGAIVPVDGGYTCM
ncbi:MAG: SDR family NAD(P)-dependent oxidoreductase [Eggerthellaceae bacterium]|jgi:NAD(P)-dependent dehydrogenase (short-subunit alcohol dehydrogenase family)